jgi:Ca2+-binding RTX toxin-like protein
VVGVRQTDKAGNVSDVQTISFTLEETTVTFASVSNVQTISFKLENDKILLNGAISNSGENRSLTDDQFESGSNLSYAKNLSTRIIYNSISGALYYDADGSALNFTPTNFATLTGQPLLTERNFFIA